MHPKPKKSLGQNFLVDKNIQKIIIHASGLNASDTVLEIGAGRGELTGLILGKAKSVYALDIDAELCSILRNKFKNYRNLKIINENILKLDFKHFFKTAKVKIIGNIPYYISSQILEHLVKFKDKIDTAFLTLQKEFARRLTALPGSKDYGAFSCFVQYHFEPKIILNIKKTSFLPHPKVDSCLVRLEIKRKTALNKDKEARLFKIIRSAFGKRRKTLRNSLKEIISPETLECFFNKYSIDRNIRPEDLSLADFANLVQ